MMKRTKTPTPTKPTSLSALYREVERTESAWRNFEGGLRRPVARKAAYDAFKAAQAAYSQAQYAADIKALTGPGASFADLKAATARAGAELREAREQVTRLQQIFDAAMDRQMDAYALRQQAR